MNDASELRKKADATLRRGVLVVPIGSRVRAGRTSVLVIECEDERANEVRIVLSGDPDLVGAAVAEALRRLQEKT